MDLLQIPGEIQKVETMMGKSLKIIFRSQEELTPDMMVRLMAMHQRYGWFTFLPGEARIEPASVLDTPKVFDKPPTHKSPSQRLRAIFFRLWESQGKPRIGHASSDEVAFEIWYEDQMNRLCEHFKAQITAS